MNEQSALWMEKAQKDLKTAEILLASETIITESVCFHSQQCAEKALKAWLVGQKTGFRKTHDLAELMALAVSADSSFGAIDREEITGMTYYAAEMRYPDNPVSPDAEMAAESFRLAKEVYDFIGGKLK